MSEMDIPDELIESIRIAQRVTRVSLKTSCGWSCRALPHAAARPP